MTNEERGMLAIGAANGPIVRSDGRSFVLTAETDKLPEAREWIQDMTASDAQLDRYRTFGRLPARISVMTGEFEYNEIANRPPHYLVRMLQSSAAAPNPPWRERWERWSRSALRSAATGRRSRRPRRPDYLRLERGAGDAEKDGAGAPS